MCAKYALALAGLLCCLSVIAISGCHRERTCESPRYWVNGVCVYPCPPGQCDGSSDVNAADEGTDGMSDAGIDVTSDARSDAVACEGDATLCNGSCVDLSRNVQNCGTCGRDCTLLPHVAQGDMVTCQAGRCVVPMTACEPGWGDWNGNEDDGCEADLSQPSHCGACGVTCSGATPVCTAMGGSYRCTNGCSAETPTLCNGSCVNTNSNPAHCGGCGITCPGVVNGRATCNSGVCSFECSEGYHRCGSTCADNNSVMTCGARCEPCPVPPNATATCTMGTCGFRCNDGFADCDGNAANGCEVNTQTSVSHCGRCGNTCSFPNASAMCMLGSCVLASCNSGYDDCDGNAANGCEVNTQTSVSHCGRCGNACTAPANATATCTAGACGFSCSTGWDNCDGNATNGCETNLRASVLNCGTCGRACTSPANATATCMGGACDFVCNAGYVRSGDMCLPAPPRPIAPLSTAFVTSQRPVLRWELPAGSDGARVELCRDRAMTRSCVTFDITGATGTPPSALSPGVWFWRLRGRAGGSTGTATSPVWQFWVGARSAPVNTSWGTALDINGDGYTDLAVGSPEADGARGRVDVFLGGSGGIASSPNVTLWGAAAGDRFGFSVASAGDINGDGFADLVVGAYQADPGGRMDAGTASVYLGGPTGLSTTPHRVLEGAAAGDWFGSYVASAGDINGDGFADLAVEAYQADPGGRTNAGAVSVYLGGPTGLSATPHRVLEGTAAYDYFGVSVASAGDINGDGYADLVVGAYGADPGRRIEAGTASVYLGSSSGLSATAHTVLEGNEAGDNLGVSVASAGDINGDGYADVVVGAHRANPGGRMDAGTASVYLGGPSGLSATPHRVLEGTMAGDEFGASVASAGDINGDGFADLVVGARWADPGGRMNAGTASVYLGGAMGLVGGPYRVLEGAAAGDWFGYPVAGAGDINGDGFTDLVVAAFLASPAGTASVYLGSAMEPVASTHRVLVGAAAGNWFGRSVAGATW